MVCFDSQAPECYGSKVYISISDQMILVQLVDKLSHL